MWYGRRIVDLWHWTRNSLDTEDGGHVSDSSVRVRPPLARRVVEAMAVEVGGMDSSAAPPLAPTAAVRCCYWGEFTAINRRAG